MNLYDAYHAGLFAVSSRCMRPFGPGGIFDCQVSNCCLGATVHVLCPADRSRACFWRWFWYGWWFRLRRVNIRQRNTCVVVAPNCAPNVQFIHVPILDFVGKINLRPVSCVALNWDVLSGDCFRISHLYCIRTGWWNGPDCADPGSYGHCCIEIFFFQI